jgi:hypothetical protein
VLLGALFGLGPHAAASPAASILASYSFEDESPSGPDTFTVFRGARGHVRLSSSYRVSGYRSVELKDEKNDGDFPELVGYFEECRAGKLFFHFTLLTTDPREELNVALAGPRFFGVEKDGIAFWLAVREGQLVHHSDSISRRLGPIAPFVWHAVDVAYDVGAGTYDLRIAREGESTPMVALRNQANAAAQPRSAVDKFSFVGDPFGDASSARYYVDDVVVGTDEAIATLPFVAPGRRRFFVDLFLAYERRLLERPRCLPVVGSEDFGVDDASPLAAAWAETCDALEDGDLDRGLRGLDALRVAAPSSGLVALSRVVALAAKHRFREASEEIALASAGWRDDPRYAAAVAYLGLKRDDLQEALEVLRDPASRVLSRARNPFLGLLGREGLDRARLEARLRGANAEAARERLEDTLLVDQYFFVQLFPGDTSSARDYALALRDRLEPHSDEGASWTERAGDACFARRDLFEARGYWEQARRAAAAREAAPAKARLDLKLADVAFLEGNHEAERRLRERHYGALRE